MRTTWMGLLLGGCTCGTFAAHLDRYESDYEGVEQCGAHDGTFAELDMLGTTLKVRLAPKVQGPGADDINDIYAWFAIPVAMLEQADPNQNVFFAAEARYVNGDKESLGDPDGEVYVLESLGESVHGHGEERKTYVSYRLRWDLTFSDPDYLFNWLESSGEDEVRAAE